MARSAPALPGALSLGIDVGGTFTDVVASWDANSVRVKVPSTPEQPAAGVLAACRAAADAFGSTVEALLGRTVRLALGTTAVTNLLATGGGRAVGLLTTRGFEDLVPLARGYRHSEDGWLVPPTPIVPRRRIIGIDERCGRDGQVVRTADPDEVAAAATYLVERCGAESLVVSYLWGFRNPANEEASAAVIRAVHPDVPVILGSVVAPVIREYERTQAALLNAAVAGSLDWLEKLGKELSALGFRHRLVLTHSNGGVVSATHAAAVPVGLVQSGPAAGAGAAVGLVGSLGRGIGVTCDMGGTSLDVALVTGKGPVLRSRGRVIGHWTCIPMTDVDSVGAGGGSVAWVDKLGGLRVGPHSAGAEPGPACYGHGGTDATVTDALVVLGYIPAGRSLGGRITVDGAAAEGACGRLGTHIGLGPAEAAWGIREVALARMSQAVRHQLASRGLAAVDLDLVAFGGCGPLFGSDIAQRAGATRCFVPALASVFSAYGAATAPMRRQRSLSVVQPMPVHDSELRTLLGRLAAQVRDDFVDDVREAEGLWRVELEADLRFERQGHDLTVRLDVTGADDAALRSITSRSLSDAFVTDYTRRYGKGALATGIRVELVTLRATGVLGGDPVPAASADGVSKVATDTDARTLASPEAQTQRPLTLERGEPPVPVPVFDWAGLHPGTRLEGPVLVDAADTTAWVPPGHAALVMAGGTIEITRGSVDA
jgi:N-methylhydantoinase A